tara:strand:- start:83779 stop:86991 length:3213 start_codon:yes stop_codon:yes gene_type:complete
MQSMRHFSGLLTVLLFPASLLSQALSGSSNGLIANQGQWHDEVVAAVNMGDARVWVLHDGLRFAMALDSGIWVSTERFVDANQSSHWESDASESSQVVNFHLGKRQASGLPLVQGGWLRNVYPGVDLRISVQGNQFKTTWYAKQSEALARVRTQWEGVNRQSAYRDELHLQLPAGSIHVSMPASYAKEVLVKSTWRRDGKQWRMHAKGATVIDPIYLFSSFSGSTSDNFGYTATYDAMGRTWAGGTAFGSQYPTSNGFQSSFGGAVDMAFMLFAGDGLSIISSTYVGGSGAEQPHSMMVAPNGDLVVMGTSNSSNFPHTSQSWDSTRAGGPATNGGGTQFNPGPDLVLFRLDSTGSQLLGSTYAGGSGSDGINALIPMNYGDQARGDVLVTSDAIYAVSSTQSTDFPATLDSTLGGSQDGLIMQWSPFLDSLNWASLVGGTQLDACFGATLVDHNNQMVLAVVGASTSDNLASSNAYQSSRGGNVDAWISTYDASNGSPIASSYLGESLYDAAFMVGHQPKGAWLTTGDSSAIAFIGLSQVGLQDVGSHWSQSSRAQFIAWMPLSLDSLYRVQSFGSPSGARPNISPTAFSMDPCGSVYLSGWGGLVNSSGTGNTTNLYTTPDAYDSITDGSDFYFMVLGRHGSPLYATYFGGQGSAEHVDGGTSRFDPSGVIHQAICAGCGGNSLLPIFPHNAYATINGSSNCNMAAVQIAFEQQAAQLDLQLVKDSLCIGTQAELIGVALRSDSARIDWGDGTMQSVISPLGQTHWYATDSMYVIQVSSWDTLCQTWDSQTLILHVHLPDPPKALMSLVYDPCDSTHHVELHPTDSLNSHALLVMWGDGDSHYEVMKCPMIHDYRLDNYGPFTITLIAYDTLCGLADTATWVVSFRPPLGHIVTDATVDPCTSPPQVSLNAAANQATHYAWYPNGLSGSAIWGQYISLPTTVGSHDIVVVAVDSTCLRYDTLTVTYQVGMDDMNALIFPSIFTPNGDGVNDWCYLPEAAQSSLASLNFQVYSRWGQLVFETTDPNFAWGGESRTGALPDGVYFWVAHWTSLCGSEGDHHGSITINRKP